MIAYRMEKQPLQVSVKTQKVAGTRPGPQEDNGVAGGEKEPPGPNVHSSTSTAAPRRCQGLEVWEKASLLFPSCQGPDRCVTLWGWRRCSPGREGYSPVITRRQ